ncbi:MAG: hypothetical protein ACKVRP_07870 [Bacteroidota bacterium]
MKTKVFIYLVILGLNAFSNGLVELILPGAREPFRLLTFAADGLLILTALTSMFYRLDYSATRMFIAFLVFSLLTFFYNFENVTIESSLNGIRQPLVFICSLILAYDILDSGVRGRMVQWMHRFLFVFVLLQIPVAYRQFSVYGASDWVGGTLGYGASGILTQLLFLITFYLVVRYGSTKEFTAFSLPRSIPFLLVLIPCALNETKIAFVFLALMIFLLAFTGKVLRAIPMLVVGVLLLMLLSYYYSENVQDTEKLFDLTFLERYLVYDSRTSVDVPRLQKMLMMFDLMARDIPAYFVGLGYGVFTGGNLLETSEYSRGIVADFRGTRALLNSLWLQGGILGVLTFIGAMFSFVRSKYELQRNVMSFRLFMVATLILMWLYNEAILNRVFAMVVAFFLAWIETGALTADEVAETEGADVASHGEGDIENEGVPSYISPHQR